jgi:signal transduction histidine kinase/CheY-like chemotaxis protein
MSKANSLFLKIWISYKPIVKVLFVYTAFLFMAVSSCIIMSRIVPKTEYQKELFEMGLIIGILGLLLATALSVVLMRIDTARYKADLRNQQMSNFLAIMSHEIRTPMNAIMGIAESQLLEHETLPSGITEAFDRVYYSGSLLLQIINDLLDLSKIEAGKLDINPEKYEVANLIEEIIHFNKIRFDSKPIEFLLDVDKNIPTSLIGDDLRIKQILNNLLSNAFKYTWKGEVKLSITSNPDNEDKSSMVLVINVSDTGQGISSQDLKILFTEYTRFNIRANRSTVGTGLGLSITQNLVQLMNGKISVKSELKQGSTFTVHLPQKIDAPTDTGLIELLGKDVVNSLNKTRFLSLSQVKRPAILREDMSYGSVLIVDDVEMNLFVAKLLLRPYGLKVDTASSGFEAIDKITAGKVYDVIFMDHVMPKMDGIEAVKILRDRGYTNPIVALTANAVSGQADVFLSNGFNDFISKPINLRILDVVLNKHVRDKHNNNNANGQPLRGHEQLQEQEKGGSYMEGDMFFNLPGLNIEQGLNVFDGEMEDYVSALQSFIKNAPEVLEKLRNINEENLPEYAINIHGLKSISGWICAENIRANAATLEALAKAGDLSGVIAQNNKFLKDTETFVKDLGTLLEKYSGQ